MAAISTVQIDIADFLLHVLETPAEDRGEWLTQFARSLAKRDLDGHSYACKCLLEVEEYREREAQRKAALKKSKDSTDSKEGADSDNGRGIPLHTDNQSINHTEKHKDRKRGFAPPSVEEVRAYCAEKNYSTDPETFVAFYGSKGWKVGNAPMKDWKLCLVTWEKRNGNRAPSTGGARSPKPARTRGEHVENLRL